MTYDGPGNFRDVPEELVKLFNMENEQKTLDEDFKGWDKEDREIFDFEESGSGLNAYMIRVNETDLLEFFLAAL